MRGSLVSPRRFNLVKWSAALNVSLWEKWNGGAERNRCGEGCTETLPQCVEQLVNPGEYGLKANLLPSKQTIWVRVPLFASNPLPRQLLGLSPAPGVSGSPVMLANAGVIIFGPPTSEFFTATFDFPALLYPLWNLLEDRVKLKKRIRVNGVEKGAASGMRQQSQVASCSRGY